MMCFVRPNMKRCFSEQVKVLVDIFLGGERLGEAMRGEARRGEEARLFSLVCVASLIPPVIAVL